jgi:hypothetical protein
LTLIQKVSLACIDADETDGYKKNNSTLNYYNSFDYKKLRSLNIHRCNIYIERILLE